MTRTGDGDDGGRGTVVGDGDDGADDAGDDEANVAGDDGGDRAFALAGRGLQLLLVGLVGYAAAVGEMGIVVNGVLSLLVTFVPSALEWRYDHRVDPRLDLWIAIAATVHVVGFFGPYTVQSGLMQWYDSAAHAISASFVAGVGYALVEALDHGSERISFPDEFRFVFVLAFIMAFGVGWEIAEFAGGALGKALGGTEILTQYGIGDIVSDFVFNTVAAAVVVLVGARYFEDVADIFTGRLSGSD